MIQKVLWQAELGQDGFPTGVYLDQQFAAACDSVLLGSEMAGDCSRYVWGITKPAAKTIKDCPGDMFTFWGDPNLRHQSALGEGRQSLLLSGVYLRHESRNGKWLTTSDYRLSQHRPLAYSFHHATFPGDHDANRWLLFAFSRWVQFAQMVMQRQMST